MNTQKTLSWLVALAGLWEVIAAFTLGYSASSAALWNAIIVGTALIVLGTWAAVSTQPATDKALDWINALLGLWLLIAPFLLGYRDFGAAFSNDVLVGIAVMVLAGWAALVVGRQQPMTK